VIEKVLNKEYQRLSRLKYDYEQIINKLPKGSVILKNRKNTTYYYLVFRDKEKIVFQYIGKDKNKIKDLKIKILQRKKIQLLLKGINKDLKILYKYSSDNMIIKKIADKIKKAVDPEKIILFGSYAIGRQKKESDLDILIIMNSNLPRYKRSVPVYKALAGILIPKDIIVYTPEEVEDWKDVPQAFVTTAVLKGKVLYEKK